MGSARLADDAALPPFDLAWAPAGVLELFNSEVLPRVQPGRRVAAVTIEWASYLPGRSCVLLYALTYADGARGRAAATFGPEVEPGAGGAGETPVPVVLLRERRCLVEFFGRDFALPALGPAVDPERIAPALAEIGLHAPIEVALLRYRPHHSCVLRYAGTTAAGRPRDLIGKVYRDRAQAERVRGRLARLAEPAGGKGLVIPAALGLAHEGLVLMECLEGRSLKHALAETGAGGDVDSLLGAAAAALAALHALPTAEGEPWTIAAAAAGVRERARGVAPAAPELSRRVEDLLAEVVRRAGIAPPAAEATLHGDFKPSQLLLAGQRMGVVDLDRAGPGDPALDLGNFTAQFHKDALRPGEEGRRDLAKRFLVAYGHRAADPGAPERARLGLALALVRMALRRFERDPHSFARRAGESRTARLLDEAGACLG
jgi:aminoglycoside phosphotransferase